MKLIMKKEKFLVFLIVLLAFALRVYNISEYPAGLNADEAAIGYNAYSLIQTGKDEFGHPWPINFQSFNDYKPGFYFYLVFPFVKFIGLNEFAVRLPSVILGTLTVLLIYFLVVELGMGKNRTMPFLSSLLLAISPWHLHFSRGGWESNASVFFMVMGIFAFLKSLKNNRWFFVSVLSLILAMYTYHSARVIVPFLIIGLLISYFSNIFKQIKTKFLVLSIFLGIVLVIPLGISLLNKDTSSRFSGVGIFADQGPFWRANELRGQHINFKGLFPKFLHNRYIEYTFLFIDNYLRHYSGNYLFILGDEIQRNRVPDMGQMYLIEFPLLVLGLYFLIKKKPSGWRFVVWWLAVAPVASSLTFQSPHAIRSLNMVIPLIMVTSYGLNEAIGWCKHKGRLIVILLSCCLVVGYGWNIAYYLHEYYVHYPKIYPSAWEYGFKDLVNYVSQNSAKYDKIYVTNKYDQPYILFDFYLKEDPKVFQNEAKLTPRDNFGFSTVDHFGKYYFGAVDLKKIDKNSLVIGTPDEIPNSATILKRIYFKDGKTEAFRITEI